MTLTLTPGVYSTPSHTSQSAAALITAETSATQRRQILRALFLAGIHGCTRDELQTQCEMSGDSVSPRAKSLIADGLVELSGEIRKTAKGRDAEVLVLTLAGKLVMGEVA